jgi:hypothetical protein
MTNAAACYTALSAASNSLSAAQDTLSHARKVLMKCPKDHVERELVYSIMTSALRLLFSLTSDMSLLTERIQVDKERFDIVCQTGQCVWPIYWSYCHSYQLLHEVTGDYAALGRAVEYGDLSVLHVPIHDKCRPAYVYNYVLKCNGR